MNNKINDIPPECDIDKNFKTSFHITANHYLGEHKVTLRDGDRGVSTRIIIK